MIAEFLDVNIIIGKNGDLLISSLLHHDHEREGCYSAVLVAAAEEPFPRL